METKMILLLDTTKEHLGEQAAGELERMRLLVQLMFRTVAKKRFEAVAKEWGCTVPLDYRPWD